MSRDADEIRREIDETRDELGETLEAIGARVAPGHVAQQVREDVGDRLDEIGDKVSPKRILQRRTEGLRSALREVVQSGAGPEGDAAATGGLGPRLRRMSATAAEQVSAAPAEEQARARVLAAFGGGLALTAVLPAFARRRPFTLVVGAVIAGVAMARLTR